jgi:16S rRNA (guanine527-N7)-methyltransferase
VQQWTSEARTALETAGISLPSDTMTRLAEYAEHVVRRGAGLNLVSAGDLDRVLERHVFDSLVGLPLISWEGMQVADIGSGAGLPGIPLAIVCEQAQFLLIERTRKRAAFLMSAISTLGLTNAQAIWGDVQDVAATRGTYADVVTVRAVANTTAALELAGPIVNAGSNVLLWQTDEQHNREETPDGWSSEWVKTNSRDEVERGIRICRMSA